MVAFVCAVLHPSRFPGRAEEHAAFREAVNFQLSFYGLAVGDDGTPRPVGKATTISEAQARANELHEELVRRQVHAEVLQFCKEEFLEQNYFHCVLEATKSVAQRLRDLTGLGGDGASLVDATLGVRNPRLAINTLRTDTEQSEQKGLGNLIKGAFGVFRNVTAHAPKVLWAVNKRDALDALGVLSHIHRRLDDAVPVPGRK